MYRVATVILVLLVHSFCFSPAVLAVEDLHREARGIAKVVLQFLRGHYEQSVVLGDFTGSRGQEIKELLGEAFGKQEIRIDQHAKIHVSGSFHDINEDGRKKTNVIKVRLQQRSGKIVFEFVREIPAVVPVQPPPPPPPPPPPHDLEKIYAEYQKKISKAYEYKNANKVVAMQRLENLWTEISDQNVLTSEYKAKLIEHIDNLKIRLMGGGDRGGGGGGGGGGEKVVQPTPWNRETPLPRLGVTIIGYQYNSAVKVVSVTPRSPAWKTTANSGSLPGIKTGDVLYTINGERVTSIDHAVKLTAESPADIVIEIKEDLQKPAFNYRTRLK
jgi:hypothetical protein